MVKQLHVFIVGIARCDFSNVTIAILLPCSYHQLTAAILAQTTPRLICACADASYVTTGNSSASFAIHAIEEPESDTIDKVLRQNDVDKTIYISNAGGYCNLRNLRVDLRLHYDDVTLASWHFKSTTTRFFTQMLVQVNSKLNIKVRY